MYPTEMLLSYIKCEEMVLLEKKDDDLKTE